ncbi:MAG: hypothetical protein JW703_01985 [Candidatus Diapherotrites archaeon]|nr:hypothetical protein [Candidatus Diapherotrites archaeon]
MNEIIFLGFFTEIWTDFNLVLKIFVLLTIASYVRNHIGNNTMGLIIIGFLAVFILGDFWAFFGGIYVLYMLLMFGVSGILVDFFFISSGGPAGGGEEMNSPISAGTDLISKRMNHPPRRPGM